MRVARLIARFAEKRRIPVRRAIGPDSRFMNLLGWLVPQRLRMWLLDQTFRLVVF